MDASVQAWLISKLGRATDLTDLNTRYTRLGTARAVALEVLNERLADLRAQVATVNVSSVVSVSISENIRAYEREIALLESGASPAPDDPAGDSGDSGDTALGVLYLVERPRR
ncbi:hypothetical protein [Streptomyces sp. NBC_00878]|uniref:hypothetical protein n=1 Tax=Streptomyces sp. NBC_00878 TaxID=2975854 RepID=UPI00225978A5|nr:hypothetical protein [Streptomyces sp. NBC_00878]MCX4911808.1 hypothetical protein [Streptomyces sp. NBC_00878]